MSDILNLFLALLLLLNNSIKCIFTICTWRIIKGSVFKTENKFANANLTRSEGSREKGLELPVCWK